VIRTKRARDRTAAVGGEDPTRDAAGRRVANVALCGIVARRGRCGAGACAPTNVVRGVIAATVLAVWWNIT
jgi:hypothetical protein